MKRRDFLLANPFLRISKQEEENKKSLQITPNNARTFSPNGQAPFLCIADQVKEGSRDLEKEEEEEEEEGKGGTEGRKERAGRLNVRVYTASRAGAKCECTLSISHTLSLVKEAREHAELRDAFFIVFTPMQTRF